PAAAPTPPVSSATTATAPLPDPKTPQEFFARARALSDLEASGIPFHLKATYVASGDAEFTGNGTYEEWWQSKDLWRKEATLGDYRYVAIRSGGKNSVAATTSYIPLRVRQVMGLQVFHIAMPEQENGVWGLSRMTGVSGVKEVATLKRSCGGGDDSSCAKQYDFAGVGVLQSYRVNDLAETYTGFQPFGNEFFPMKVTVTLRGDALLIVHIVSLEKLSGAEHGPMDTNTPADLPSVPSRLFEYPPAKDVTPPKPVHVVRVKYPKSERKSHPNRLVIVACTIDATGAVREPYVQLSGGTPFDQAAMDAVRKCHFSPAAKNGIPGMADLSIAISFRIY
ncbi:MAG: energy transducer TonB, partial [Acidobacteriaceae bacterium]